MLQFKWNVPSLLNLFVSANYEKYAFLVLNAPIRNPETVLQFWRKASLRMVIDGGGNKIYDLLRKFRLDDDEMLPHVVSGDFDSIRNDVLTTYRNHNVKIIHTPDQNNTDFYKGLLEASSLTEAKIVMVLCEHDGRFDHIMSNVNTLFKAVKNNCTKRLNVYLLSSDNLTWLLQPGYHVIEIPPDLWNEKSFCALIPVGNPCRHVNTTGLKWNLHDGTLEFGAMVSSSNAYDINQERTVVTVQTESNIIWSMGISKTVP